MNEHEAREARVNVAAYIEEQGLEYVGPSDDSAWPEGVGQKALLFIGGTIGGEALTGIYRARNPLLPDNGGMLVVAGSLDGTPPSEEMLALARAYPGAQVLYKGGPVAGVVSLDGGRA